MIAAAKVMINTHSSDFFAVSQTFSCQSVFLKTLHACRCGTVLFGRHLCHNHLNCAVRKNIWLRMFFFFLHFQFPVQLCPWIFRNALQPGHKRMWRFPLPPWLCVHQQTWRIHMCLPCWLLRYVPLGQSPRHKINERNQGLSCLQGLRSPSLTDS